MRTLKFSSIAVAMLMTSLCLFLTPSSNIYANSNTSCVYKIETDPRNIILFRTSIIVAQTEQQPLHVTVVRKSDGATVYQTNSSLIEITIYTEGWQSGEYLIQTNNEENDYQEFLVEL